MRLFLCGGGSDEKTVEANKKLNEIINHNKPILYVPLAMDEEKHPYDGCLEWVKGELSSVKVPNIEMVRTFEELASKNYNDYSAIFIGGGNTFKLLKGIKDSGAFYKIKEYIENDGIVYGGSAGAIIFGYDIDSCASMDSNDVGLEDTKGFDALNGLSIFAHYTNHSSKLTEEENMLRDEKYTQALQKFSFEKGQVIALPEEDTIFINGDSVEVIGTLPYYRFRNGARSTIEIEYQGAIKIK